jgi:hypothetical protein
MFLGHFHCVEVVSVIEVSEAHVASMFTVEVSSMSVHPYTVSLRVKRNVTRNDAKRINLELINSTEMSPS